MAKLRPYVPLAADRLAAATIVVHTSTDPRPLLVPVRSAAARSGLTPAVSEMQATLPPAANSASLIRALGRLATALAFVGILGLVAFTVSEERRQIGIRIALGARPLQVGSRRCGLSLLQ